jgi:uncharacterized protein YhaN
VFGAELAAEVADVDVDDVGAGVEVKAPDVAEDLLAGEDLARVAEEQLGEGKLASAEVDEAVADVRAPGAKVEAEIAALEHGDFGSVLVA